MEQNLEVFWEHVGEEWKSHGTFQLTPLTCGKRFYHFGQDNVPLGIIYRRFLCSQVQRHNIVQCSKHLRHGNKTCTFLELPTFALLRNSDWKLSIQSFVNKTETILDKITRQQVFNVPSFCINKSQLEFTNLTKFYRQNYVPYSASTSVWTESCTQRVKAWRWFDGQPQWSNAFISASFFGLHCLISLMLWRALKNSLNKLLSSLSHQTPAQ